MIADKLISRLEGVKQTGPGRWMAKCSAHDDRSPSLVITEINDRVLIHCFTGCDVYDVVSTVGLELSDLFPENLNTYHKSIKNPFNPKDILAALYRDIVWLQVCASQSKQLGFIGEYAKGELNSIAERFEKAMKYAGAGS